MPQATTGTSHFLLTLRVAIEARLDDPTLGVDDLCAAVFLCRAQLYRRLKAETGLSATLYIRAVRLERACHLLRQPGYNVSRVAYEVGFEDPAFFSRVFAQAYGKPPSAFLVTGNNR